MISTYFYRPDKDTPAYYNKRPGKDAGYDLYALEDIWVWPFQTKKIPTNSHIHIPSDHYGAVLSRSGHAGRGWLTHHSPVDHGYAGNIHIIQTNLSLFPRRIKKGTRIAQLVFVPFSTVVPRETYSLEDFKMTVERLSESDRGEKAFNSSGQT